MRSTFIIVFALVSVVLTAVSAGLKLTGVVAWSWLWVLAPAWIALIIGLVVIVPILVILRIMFREGRNIP